MLAVNVTFLVSTFDAAVGSSVYRVESTTEWPPAPRRLLAALINGAASACRGDDDPFAGPRWLEAQPPPTIVASAATGSHAQVGYAPTAIESAAAAAKHTQVSTMLPGSTGLLTRTHGRVLADRDITYLYDTECPSGIQASLRRAAGHVGHLGRASSGVMVTIDNVDADDVADSDRSQWRPSPPGPHATSVRVHQSGDVEVFRQAHDAGIATTDARREGAVRVRRASRAGKIVPYTSLTVDAVDATIRADEEAPHPWRWVSPEFILPVNRRTFAGDVLSATQRIRAAVSSEVMGGHADPVLARWLLGHDPDGTPARHGTGHVAVVPLVRTGQHVEPMLLGFALAGPADVPDEVAAAIDDRLTDTFEVASWHNGPVRFRRASGSRIDGDAIHPHARQGRYDGAFDVWTTVTPAVSWHLATKQARSPDAVRRRAAKIFAEAGYPVPVELVLHKDPNPHLGVALRPQETRRSRQAATVPFSHLTFRFDRPVGGPILLGHLRHFGLGVAAPVRNPSRTAT